MISWRLEDKDDQAPVVQTLDSAIHQAPVAQKLDSAIHRVNHYPANNAIGSRNTYPLDSEFIRWIALSSFWTTEAR